MWISRLECYASSQSVYLSQSNVFHSAVKFHGKKWIFLHLHVIFSHIYPYDIWTVFESRIENRLTSIQSMIVIILTSSSSSQRIFVCSICWSFGAGTLECCAQPVECRCIRWWENGLFSSHRAFLTRVEQFLSVHIFMTVQFLFVIHRCIFVSSLLKWWVFFSTPSVNWNETFIIFRRRWYCYTAPLV